MKTAVLLDRLERVRQVRADKWTARCPAHHDRNPSFEVRAGRRRFFFKCWKGCGEHEICQALGISTRDLFFDETGKPRTPQARQRNATPPPYQWRRYISEAWNLADALWLRGDRVLAAARNLSLDSWTDDDLEQAWQAVGQAHHDDEIADQIDDLVVQLRVLELRRERPEYAF